MIKDYQDALDSIMGGGSFEDLKADFEKIQELIDLAERRYHYKTNKGTKKPAYIYELWENGKMAASGTSHELGEMLQYGTRHIAECYRNGYLVGKRYEVRRKEI